MANNQVRALIVVRISRLMEASTSPERQEEECRTLCERMGWEVVGVASDLNVSAGATSPFERPSLGRWLGTGKDGDPGRSHEFDVIVFWRLDRLVRSMTQLSTLMTWAEQRGVSLKSATEGHIDTTTGMGRVMAMLVGSFAEMELEAIRERTGADQHHRIVSGKYRGALPSWGYRPVKDPVKGWIVEPDPVQVAQINKAVDMVLAGVSMNEIARVFNTEGVPTPRALSDIRQGKEPRKSKWRGNRMKDMLVSQSMLGYALYREPKLDGNGKPLRGKNGRKVYESEPRIAMKDGVPVKRADAVIAADRWERMRKELESREIIVSARSSSLLIQVLFCGVCGRPAYKLSPNNGRSHRYRCRSTQDNTLEPCSSKSVSVRTDYIEPLVTDMFLKVFGDSVRAVKVWDNGNNNADEVAELEQGIKVLAGELARHRPGSVAFNAIGANIDIMQDRLDALGLEVQRPAGWVMQPTGETVRQWWDKADVVERNAYLREMGVRVAYEHDEERSRKDPPRVHIEFGDFLAATQDLDVKGTAELIKETLGTAGQGTTVHIRDGKTWVEET